VPISSLVEMPRPLRATSSVNFNRARTNAGLLPTFGGNLLDGILRLFKPQERGEAAGLVQRMHVAALEVLDDGGFERLGVGQFDDADGRGFESGQLRGAIAPRSGNDLEVLGPLGAQSRGKQCPAF
jgi:hypothetical protein